jgi:putative transposase
MNVDLPVRKSTRLKTHDYSHPGWYYVTICTHNRALILGKIVNNTMSLSPLGHIVNETIIKFPNHWHNTAIDTYQIMPNHIHLIIGIVSNGRTQRSVPTISLPNIIKRFKTYTTHQYASGIRQYGWQPFDGKIWQRNYYEHIVRDQHDMDRIREYIQNNIFDWHKDRLHSP